MTLFVFLTVLCAAVLHASWNALVKGSSDKALGVTAVVAGHVPPALLVLYIVPAPLPASWPYIAAGAVLHSGYQLFLMNAYRFGDLTQVYPIARGVAPLIVTMVSIAFLGVVLAPLQLTAIALIAIGIMSLTLVRRADGLRNPRAATLAIAAGCFIASYSLVDGLGARLSGDSWAFYAWLTMLNAALMIPIMSIASPGIASRLLSDGRRLMAIGGTASFIAYSLVTWAFTQAPIALVTALRETSIIFALLIGVLYLKERLDLAKVISTVVTLAGAALLRLAR